MALLALWLVQVKACTAESGRACYLASKAYGLLRPACLRSSHHQVVLYKDERLTCLHLH